MPETDATGVEIMRGNVRDEWIDVNDHMNVAYYVLAFDLAVDEVWNRFGITDDYVGERGLSTFAVECHVCYVRELRRGDPYRVTTQLLAWDEKRLHQFQRMYHAGEGWLAATAEWMNLHVDLRKRRVAPWPDSVIEALQRFIAEHGEWPHPAEAGKRMHVPRPLYSVY